MILLFVTDNTMDMSAATSPCNLDGTRPQPSRGPGRSSSWSAQYGLPRHHCRRTTVGAHPATPRSTFIGTSDNDNYIACVVPRHAMSSDARNLRDTGHRRMDPSGASRRPVALGSWRRWYHKRRGRFVGGPVVQRRYSHPSCGSHARGGLHLRSRLERKPGRRRSEGRPPGNLSAADCIMRRR